MATHTILVALFLIPFITLLSASFANSPRNICRPVTAQCVVVPDPAAPFQVSGVITLAQPGFCEFNRDILTVNLQLQGFPISGGYRLQGFHVHQFGDLSNGCASTGSHFNPLGMPHGGPSSIRRHIGDFGNFPIRPDGTVYFTLQGVQASLSETLSIMGRAIVIHAQTDDLGQGGNAGSQRTGNAGSRLACCVITPIQPLPYVYYG